MNTKKTSRSFRIDDRLWKYVQEEADQRGTKPTDIVIEAIAGHLGMIIRKKEGIDDKQVLEVLKKTTELEDELKSIKATLGQL